MRGCICFDGCPFILDALCVEYTGAPLTNLNIDSGANGEEIIEALDIAPYDQLPFYANSDNSIYAVGGGLLGHSPFYNVRLNPSTNNIITISTDGVLVILSGESDGKVKVNAADPKAYLEDQFGPASDDDNILTVTPTTSGGKVNFIPSINVENLLLTIQSTYEDEFCEIIADCIPH